MNLKKKNLYLLCGPSGVGKTTWVKNNMGENGIHISRDIIRFALLKDDEDYFSKEDEVWEEFIDAINNEILYGAHSDIYIDATHLNERSRNKILNCLYLENIDIYPVNFFADLNTCLEQNELRKDNKRAYVPRSAIRNMFYAFKPANNNERYEYAGIINIYNRGKENE